MSSCQKCGCLQRSYRLLLPFSIVKTSSAGFKELGLQIVIVPNIASFFFTLQSSAFWPFKRPKWRRLMTVNIKKKKPGLTRVWPGRPGFSGSISKRVFASTQTGPKPGSARSRVGRVPGRPAKPVRALKLWQCSLILGPLNMEWWSLVKKMDLKQLGQVNSS